MSFSSAVKLGFQHKAPFVDVKLKTTMSCCRLRPQSSDIDCLGKVFLWEEYSLPFVLDPRVIIDGGANIGAAALYFATKYPYAKIFALEPEPSNFMLLRKNCAHLGNVVALQAALWPRPEALALTDPTAEKWAFSVRKGIDGEDLLRGITIEELMSKYNIQHIDLLKLDIEGAEKELFSACSVQWLDRVNVIAIELHDRYIAGCSQAFYSALYGRRFVQEMRGENIFIKLLDSRAAT